MQNISVTNEHLQQIELALKIEKSNFAKAFHRGKSLSELNEQVKKIHKLEKQLNALYVIKSN